MRATKIKMKPGCGSSYSLVEIDEIFVSGTGWNNFYKKGDLHDYIKRNPGSIQVDLSPYPDLVPATSPYPYSEKYVRSEPNDSTKDNLLKLPRV